LQKHNPNPLLTHYLFVKWLLDFVATNPDAILTYKNSDMVLSMHSNASYLSKPSAGGHFFCSSNVKDPPDNVVILNTSKILKAAMSSAAKAELGALYINAWEAIPMQLLLKVMGHNQSCWKSSKSEVGLSAV
jgi:hypothetical protein